MQLSKRTRRIAAASLLAVLFTNTLAPTVAYALTSGPTAPEATSFEPVDTTDMVNLQTGDLIYNIPLLEVPGPEGGYPLSLAYHAGIQPNEDASWVGLGWSLNPGAVTRNVNGFPDDWTNPSALTQVYWSGTSGTTYSVGLSIGIANSPATVTFGLAFSQDQYEGFSVSPMLGFGLGISVGPISLGVGMGPGGAYGSLGAKYGPASLGFKVTEEDITLNGKVGGGYGPFTATASFSTDFSSLSAGFTGGMGIMEASINTGKSASFSIGGLTSSFSSSTQAGVQSEKSSFGLDIPIPFVPGLNLSLAWGKYRYWIDNATNVVIYGSLFSEDRPLGDNIVYDSYSMLENSTDKSIVDYADPTILQGGAYLDFDIYNVSAQGLGGTMRPYLFQGEVLGQNRKNTSNAPLVTYHSPGHYYLQPQFRFIGDFSNTYRQPFGDYSYNSNLLTATPPFGASTYGQSAEPFAFAGGKLAGSRSVEVGVSIKPVNTLGYVETDRYKAGMIKGFSITNESGVTYHYGLPAYSYGEHIYQEKRRIGEEPLSYNKNTRNEAYAYTWYLTTITGPDFVDRDGDGMAGINDWGHWVNFEYGKWSNRYVWRNPAVGFHVDEDNNFQNVSMGAKEVYYVNAIRTRSHVALFEKDIRLDGKSASPPDAALATETNPNPANPPGVYGVNSSQSLRLNKIYLLNATDAVNLLPASGNNTAYEPLAARYTPCSDCELAPNVLDKTDVDAVGRYALEAMSLRIIDFEYDYSLCPNTVNSFDINYSPKYGKLTLNKINRRGKGGVSTVPPMKFEYELDATDRQATTVNFTNSETFVTTNGKFEIGDLIMVEGTSDYFAGPVYSKTFSGGSYSYQVEMPYGTAGSRNIRKTKNPPYRADYYDLWNMYRSYGAYPFNVNLGRRTTPATGRSVDAWSIRKVISPLGGEVKIAYESDDYRRSTFNTNQSILLYYLITGPLEPNKVTFQLDLTGIQRGTLHDYLKVGDQVDFVAWQYGTFTNQYYTNQPMGRLLDSRNFSAPVYVHSFGPGQAVTLTCANFDNILFNDKTGFTYTTSDLLVPTGSGVTYSVSVPGHLNLSVKRSDNIPGGGVRVKSIATLNAADGAIIKTNYDYRIPGTNQTSGMTSYEPVGLDKTWYDAPYITGASERTVKPYKKAVYKNLSALYAIAREIPPPGVLYEYVTVSSSVKNPDEDQEWIVEGKTEFKFEVFRENYVGRQYLPGWTSGNMKTANLVLRKFNAAIGQPRSVIQFDKGGKKINEVQHHYLHDGMENLAFEAFMDEYKLRLAEFGYQGFLQERLSEVKQVSNQTNTADNGVRATTSAREEYPCIKIGQTVTNYLNGTRMSSGNISFDFYSGAVTRSVTSDAYGNRFMTEVVPAYRIPAMEAMGVKSTATTGHRNMLTQVGQKKIYKVDANNNPIGLMDAEVTRWTNGGKVLDLYGNPIVQNNSATNGNVWRIGTTHRWQPDHRTANSLTAMSGFQDFNWSNPSASNPNWKLTSENTLYDVFSKLLEAKDMNGDHAATRMTDGSYKVMMTATPAKWDEIGFAGAEETEDNMAYGFSRDEAHWIHNSPQVHTGHNSFFSYGQLPVISYHVSTDKLVAGRSYWAGVWVKPETGNTTNVELYYSIDGVKKSSSNSAASTKTADGWKLITLVINGTDIVPGKSLRVGVENLHTGNVFVDDMMFRPLNAVATAYVYDQFSGELSYMLDNNNLYTRFEYNAGGQLTKTYREKLGYGKMKINEYTYNYGADKYQSVAINQQIFKNNCGSMAGTAVPISLPAGAFISYLSQEDANVRAMQFAQHEANRLGSCVPAGTVYVQLQEGPYFQQTDGCIYTERSPVKLKFYSDPNGTVPLYVYNLTVKLTYAHHDPVTWDMIVEEVTFVCTGTEMLVSPNSITYYDDPCGETYYSEDYSVNNSSNYSILPNIIIN